MKFIKSKPKEFYFLDTSIENVFINEYMPVASGDFVKVFLYGYMHAAHGMEITSKLMSEQLSMSPNKIEEAWNYWENMGVIKRRYAPSTDGSGEYTVEFFSLKEQLFGMSADVGDEMSEETPIANEDMKNLLQQVEKIIGRPFNTGELSEIMYWVHDRGIGMDVIIGAFNYALERGNNSFRYISKIIENWHHKNIRTEHDLKEYLDANEERYYKYNRIMKALGFSRNATEKEKALMDNWFDNMGYSIEKVLEACEKTAGISNPNFNYVDKVLNNWKKEAQTQGINVNESRPVTRKILNDYMNYLSKKAESDAADRKKEIYAKLPQIKKIDKKINELGIQMSKAIFTASSEMSYEDVMEKINTEMEALSEERAYILVENNYDMDYTEPKYKCNKCKDTGTTEMGPCSCLEERMKEAAVWHKERTS